jgi:hypothetical protein
LRRDDNRLRDKAMLTAHAATPLHEQPDAGTVADSSSGISGDAQVKQFTSAHRQPS